MAFSWTPSSGNDRLRATAEGQTINALGGNDWLRSTFNDSTLYGGNGHDRITVALDMADPNETDFARSAMLYGGNGNDRLVSHLSVQSSEEARFEVSSWQSGGTGNDTISIFAAATDEDLTGSGGLFDFDVYGGSGADDIWIEVNGAGAVNSNFVSAGAGADIVYIFSDAHNGIRDSGNVKNEVEAGDGDDDVIVSAESGWLGGGSTNVIWGGEGNDRLEALVRAESGLNTLYGGDGKDTLIATGEVGADTTADIENYVEGGAGDDTIDLNGVSFGYSAVVRNEAYGGAGDDTITSIAQCGNAINSVATDGMIEALLYGGAGNDTLTATSTFYIADQEDDPEGGATLYGGTGNDILRVYGAVENTLDGGTGDDVLIGGAGADRIIGGAGADTLRGAAGNDTFVFQWIAGATPDIRDTILDFGAGGWRGDDMIVVSAIDANVNRAGNQAFAFGGTTQKGIGFLWVEDDPESSDSLVMANNGGMQPLVIAVADGSGRNASDWRADDFLL